MMVVPLSCLDKSEDISGITRNGMVEACGACGN